MFITLAKAARVNTLAMATTYVNTTDHDHSPVCIGLTDEMKAQLSV